MNYIGDFAENAIVVLGSFTTNAADGGRESLSASLEEADITIYSDDGDGTFTAMSLPPSTILITENPGSQVGVYLVAVDMDNDPNFTTGTDYVAVLYPDETVDAQSIAGVLAHWSCENRPVQGLGADVITAAKIADNALANEHFAAGALTDAECAADVTKISGDATAANNLETACDGGSYNIGGGSVVAASVTGAVGSVTGAVGSVTGNVGGNVTGSIGSIVANAITNDAIADDAISEGKIAEGAITDAKFGTNAITAGVLASSASLEIADSIWDELQSGHVVGGSFGEIASEIASILAVTDNLPNSGALTDLATAAKLLAYIQLLSRSDVAINTDNATELTAINADGGSGAGNFDNQTDSEEAIRDRGDADWSSGASNSNVLLAAEIATVTSQIEFTLATGSDQDDAYKDQAIVLYDDTNSDFPSVRVISSYTGATKTVVIDSAPDFTLGADDSVRVFVTAPGTTAPTATTVADAVWDEFYEDHEDVGTFGEAVGAKTWIAT